MAMDSWAYSSLIARKGTFSDPNVDLLSTRIPTRLRDLMRWAEYLYFNSPHVFAAINRFAQYVVTDLIIQSDNARVKEKYTQLATSLRLKEFLICRGRDKFVHGNTFSSIYRPFVRLLECGSCHRHARANPGNFKYLWNRDKFQLTCPYCKVRGTAQVVDRPVPIIEDISLVRWDPKYIDIERNPITNRSTYFYNIPDKLRSRVLSGDNELILTLPRGFLSTIATRKYFQFEKGKLYHQKIDAPPGIDDAWGLPPIVAALKQFFYTNVLRRANEMIAMDFLTPMRVIHPAQSSSHADPTLSFSMGVWRDHIEEGIESWRRDPLHIMTSPVPLGVTTVGGQGRALMVLGEIEAAEDNIIASVGAFREFLRGGMTVAGSGVSLRMLENSLVSHTNDQIGLAQWIFDNIGGWMGWQKVTVDLQPFKLVDDVQQKTLLLNAVQNGLVRVSPETMAGLLGFDQQEEDKLIVQDQLRQAQSNRDMQKKMDAIQSSVVDAAQARVQQSTSGGQEQLIARADGLVEQLMQMDQGTRKSALHQLQTEDYVLYCIVIQRWEQAQTQTATVARQQARAGGG